MKEKRRWLATILGFFGPLGTLYFGWRVMLLNLLFFATMTLITIFVTGETPPAWYEYVTILFFMLWSNFYTPIYNDVARGNRDRIDLLHFVLTSVLIYVTLYCILTGASRSFLFLTQEYYFKAFLNTFLAIPLSIYLINMLLAFVLASLAGLINLCDRR